MSNNNNNRRKPVLINKSELDSLSLDDNGDNGDNQVDEASSSSEPSTYRQSNLPPLNQREEKQRESMTVSKQLIGPYVIGDMIGTGAFAKVFKGLNAQTGDFVAIKRFEKSKVSDEQLESVKLELDLLKRLSHENIVHVLGQDENEKYIFLFLEYMENGSLSSLLHNFGSFPETLTCGYIEQVLKGLVYLHSENVIHRDIKAANILINKIGYAKLADFNVAAQLNEHDKRYSIVGTPYWMAPEIIELNGATTKADIWSVGCTIIELLTGIPPYFNHNPMSAMFKIVQNETTPLPKNISAELTDFLSQCFIKSVEERPSAMDLLSHPWIIKYRRSNLLHHSNSSPNIKSSSSSPTNTIGGGGAGGILDSLSNTITEFNQKQREQEEMYLDSSSSMSLSEGMPTPGTSRSSSFLDDDYKSNTVQMKSTQMMEEIKKLKQENQALEKKHQEIEKQLKEEQFKTEESERKYREILLSSMHYIYIVDSSINISSNGTIKLQQISQEVTHLRNIMRDQIETEYHALFPDRNMIPRFIERRLTRDTLINLPKKSLDAQKKSLDAQKKREKEQTKKLEKLEKDKLEKEKKLEKKKLKESFNSNNYDQQQQQQNHVTSQQSLNNNSPSLPINDQLGKKSFLSRTISKTIL